MTFLAIKDQDFSDISEFVQYLKTQQSHGGNLGGVQLIPTVTSLTSLDEFITSLTSFGFKLEKQWGKLLWVSKKHDTDIVNFYIFFDDRNHVPLFLTDAKKSDEIPDILFNYLRISRDLSNLWISPTVMKDIKDDLIKTHEDLIITYFSAKRSPNAKIPAHHRSSIERGIQYRGIDGKETLYEMEFYYGVLPKILEIKIPNGISFKIDNKGIITIREGDFTSIFEIISRVVRHVRPLKNAIDTSSYSISLVGKKQFRRPIQIPWTVLLSSPFDNETIPHIRQDIEEEEWDFTLLEHSDVSDTSSFSARIIDNLSGSLFDISIQSRGMHVYPVDHISLGTCMRFYEFVLESVDSMATVG